MVRAKYATALSRRSTSSNSTMQHAGLVIMFPCGKDSHTTDHVTTTLQHFYILPILHVSSQRICSPKVIRFSQTVSVTQMSADKTLLSSATCSIINCQCLLSLSLRLSPSLFKFSSTSHLPSFHRSSSICTKYSQVVSPYDDRGGLPFPCQSCICLSTAE